MKCTAQNAGDYVLTAFKDGRYKASIGTVHYFSLELAPTTSPPTPSLVQTPVSIPPTLGPVFPTPTAVLQLTNYYHCDRVCRPAHFVWS